MGSYDSPMRPRFAKRRKKPQSKRPPKYTEEELISRRNPFFCMHCRHRFTTAEQLRDHMAKSHKEVT